eukprot:scaffold61428_cov20-Tisochrysis_lutea.AAC.5
MRGHARAHARTPRPFPHQAGLAMPGAAAQGAPLPPPHALPAHTPWPRAVWWRVRLGCTPGWCEQPCRPGAWPRCAPAHIH